MNSDVLEELIITQSSPGASPLYNTEMYVACRHVAGGGWEPNQILTLSSILQSRNMVSCDLLDSSLTKGGYHTGHVWQHMEDIGFDHTVLLATWFMGNFLA